MEKKRGRPPKVEKTEVYCCASYIKTSAGPMFHGDRKELPNQEAADLIKRGLVK